MKTLPLLTAALLVLVGCGTSSSGNGGSGTPPATYDTGSSADAEADGGASSDVADDAGNTGSDAGSGSSDSGSGSADAGSGSLDAGAPDTWVEPDTGEQDSGQAGPPPSLFAHTKDKLYAFDPGKSAMVEVGKFSFNKKKGLVTDIALDQFRNLFAITFEDLFKCNPDTAACAWIAKLPAEFNGLTFIPESLVPGSKTEALIGISEKGAWNWIKEDGKGGMTMKKLGTYGGGWLSSGDAFAVVGVGTFATLKKKSGGIDSLAKLDPKTGKLLKVIGSTGVKGLFGFAWWADVFYGFSNDGKVYVIDVTTGKATEALQISAPKNVKWWGAGVSTRANGL